MIADTAHYKRLLESSKRLQRRYPKKVFLAQISFPEVHRHLIPKIYARYDILKRAREFTILPKKTHYELEIRYKQKVTKTPCRNPYGIAIDLGGNIFAAIHNNFGKTPLLFDSKELKRLNYNLNRKIPYLEHKIDIYKNILKRAYYKKNEIVPIKKIIAEQITTSNEQLEWKKRIIDFINRNLLTSTPKGLGPELGMNKEHHKRFYNYIISNKKDGLEMKILKEYHVAEHKKTSDIYSYIYKDLNGFSTRKGKIKELQRQLNELELRKEKFFNFYTFRSMDILHKLSSAIIRLCIEFKIGTIVIGYNKNWKRKPNLPKAINRRFVSLPHGKFLEMLRYKCRLNAINFIETEEGYTSKVSAWHRQPIKKLKSYGGVRAPEINKKIHRGLYKIYAGEEENRKEIYIHSDAHGAYNIGRVGAPHLFKFNKRKETLAQYQKRLLIPPRHVHIFSKKEHIKDIINLFNTTTI